MFPTLPPLPAGSRWTDLTGASMGLAIATLSQHAPHGLLLLTADAHQAQLLQQELAFFLPQADIRLFADWETLPYDRFSPHQDIISERLATLYQLHTSPPDITIAQISSLMHYLLPAQHLLAHSLVVNAGQQRPMQSLVQQLEQAGYQRVTQVMEHGEYAVRGSLLDLFPMGAQTPVRIDWLDDEIDSLRTFDVSSQRTQETLNGIRLLPAREFPLDEAGIARFRQQWREAFADAGPRQQAIYQRVSSGQAIGGLEYYLPLFYEQMSRFTDYLHPDTQILWTDGLPEAADAFWQEVDERWRMGRLDSDRPILPPERLFQRPDALFTSLQAFSSLKLSAQTDGKGESHWPQASLPDLSLDSTREDSAHRLKQWLQEDAREHKVLLAAESLGRREVLLDLLARNGIQVHKSLNWQDFLDSQSPGLYLTVAPLNRSLWLQDRVLLSEQALFGAQVRQSRRRQRSQHADFMDGIRSLAELEVGSPVVHIDHGVGRFVGLETLTVDALAREFVTLEYAGGDRLYVPVADLHLISRYSGTDSDHAPLHKLGTDRWQKARKQAMEKVRDVAAELLDLYARRAAQKGHAFANAGADYLRFAAGFPFEETPDQQAAIEAVLADMQSARPMDRLVCGDVGFGKTEVAMRAAFMAVHAGKQVVVLVPTTLLANQHGQNFRDRFADWPIRIEVLSRFGSSKEQKQIIEQVSEGKVDIVIGTHKLLQGDVRFKDLGLIIIDEEHRFGVRQKEFLKNLRAQVDVLAMTATPIPRTLSMALADMRDMSIIATPPARRQSIQTFVQEWNRDLAREACLRELRRGGQVYVLFNDVDKIEGFAQELGELMPQTRIAIAHGQMPERQLERVMRDFYHQQFQILVCTTIIETGIDIPNANTILIHRADKFGLAQLHQLRGRVGRSHHKAYAYLFTPPKQALSTDAQKRLEAIARYDQLGAGFALATQDLEIRGAGELLGSDQSGQMQEIGFDLYAQLLDRAVRAYRRGEVPSLEDTDKGCEVDLGIAALIPDDYLPDIQSRLVLYKRISAAESANALHELQVEMVDRFGLLPEACKQLFAQMQIRLDATRLGATRLEGWATGLRITFSEKPDIDPMAIIRLIQSQPKVYQLDGPNRVKWLGQVTTAQERLQAATRLIDALSARG